MTPLTPEEYRAKFGPAPKGGWGDGRALRGLGHALGALGQSINAGVRGAATIIPGSDNISALMDAATIVNSQPGETFWDRYHANRAFLEADDAKHPTANLLGMGASMAAALPKAVVQHLMKPLVGPLVGAGIGAAFGGADADLTDPAAMLKGAGIGAGIGGALGLVPGAARGVLAAARTPAVQAATGFGVGALAFPGEAEAASPVKFFSALQRAVQGMSRKSGTGAEWTRELVHPGGTGTRSLRDENNRLTRGPRFQELTDKYAAEGRLTNAEMDEYRTLEAAPPLTEEYVMPPSAVVPGVKMEEMQDIGLQEFLANKADEPLTQEEVLAHLREREIVPQERLLGEQMPDTRDLQAAAADPAHGNVFEVRADGVPTGTLYPTMEAANRVIENMKSGSFASTPLRHSNKQWQLPGGKNYRELLITLPVKRYDATSRSEVSPAMSGDVPPFTGGHHSDIPNVMMHVRFNEREGPNGARVLHIEELQSDWHQKGRGGGYYTITKPVTKLPAGWTHQAQVRTSPYYVSELANGAGWGVFETPHPGGRVHETPAVLGAFDSESAAQSYIQGYGMRGYVNTVSLIDDTGKQIAIGGDTFGIPERAALAMYNSVVLKAGKMTKGIVPDAPMKQGWTDYGMKRMLKWAIDNDFDALSWTTGEQQVDRWSDALRKHADEIEWSKEIEGVHLKAFKLEERDYIEPNIRRFGGGGGRLDITDYLDELGIDAEDTDMIREWSARRVEETNTGREFIQFIGPDGQEMYYDDIIDGIIGDPEELRIWLTKSDPDIFGDETMVRTEVLNTRRGSAHKNDDLAAVIGKSMADKILSDPAQTGIIKGKDIRISSLGMHKHYDKRMAEAPNKFGKKYGAKVELVELPSTNKKLTEEMLERVAHHPNHRRSMSVEEQNLFVTAEDFPGSGHAFPGQTLKPFVIETKVLINGANTNVRFVLDKNGWGFFSGDEAIDARNPIVNWATTPIDAEAAERSFRRLWMKPYFWERLNAELGESGPGGFAILPPGLKEEMFRGKAVNYIPITRDMRGADISRYKHGGLVRAVYR